MLTSMSEQFDAAGVVDEVGVETPARERVLDAAELRTAEVAAFADDLGSAAPRR